MNKANFPLLSILSLLFHHCHNMGFGYSCLYLYHNVFKYSWLIYKHHCCHKLFEKSCLCLYHCCYKLLEYFCLYCYRYDNNLFLITLWCLSVPLLCPAGPVVPPVTSVLCQSPYADAICLNGGACVGDLFGPSPQLCRCQNGYTGIVCHRSLESNEQPGIKSDLSLYAFIILV